MRAFGRFFFGEMKFVLSNFLSSEDLSISYESWDVQLTFDILINAFRFKGEELKPFCFVSVSVLVFKKKQKQKRNNGQSGWYDYVSVLFLFCFCSVSVLFLFCFCSVSVRFQGFTLYIWTESFRFRFSFGSKTETHWYFSIRLARNCLA